jgi:hypothetical protein
MKLDLYRESSTPKSTPGRLHVEDVFECFTLEDPVRDHKVDRVTAIPAGTYDITITRSNRFSALASQKAKKPIDVFLPLLNNVPGFDGVRIHTGNYATETEGCILVGASRNVDVIYESRKAFDRLFQKISDALARKETVSLEIHPSA